MPPINTYATYRISFAEQAEYEFATAAAGGNIYQAAPMNAAAFFGIPWPPPSGDLSQIPKTLIGFTPYGIALSPVEVFNPNASGVFMQNNVDQVFVPGQAGVPASLWPAGDGINVIWEGVITRHNGESGIPDPGDISAIPQRRWIVGFENAATSIEGGSPPVNIRFSRDASRTFDGMGWAVRGDDSIGVSYSRTINQYNPALVTTESWERLYIRLRALPSQVYTLWRARGTPNTSQGCALRIETSGNLTVYDVNSSGFNLIGTSTSLILGKWYRLDMIAQFRNGPSNGRIRVWVDGTMTNDITQGSGTGLFGNTAYTNSVVNEANGAENSISLDIDDWINAELPKDGLGVEQLNSVDWFMGSHVRPAYNLSGTLPNWAPAALQLTNQGKSALTSPTNNTLTSSTSGATITALTDATNDPDNTGLGVGHVAAVIGQRSSNAGATDGQLGYAIAGGAFVDTTINELSATSAQSIMYRPTGMIFPTDIVPFSIRKIKSPDGNLNTLHAFQASLENIGSWGLEDDSLWPEDLDILKESWLHNCHYANTLWAQPVGIPNSPVMVIGGTYTGNATEQHINLPLPCHFLWVRALTGGNAPFIWMGANVGGHFGMTSGVAQNAPIRVWADSTGQVKFTVAGANVNTNANAVTYQYIAVCDPGMRFCLSGAETLIPDTTSFTKTLQSPSFLPVACFMQQEFINSITGSSAFTYKGPFHAGNIGTALGGNNFANWGNFGLGQLTFMNSLSTLEHSQYSFNLWKSTDDCANVMFQFASYTGNGAGARVISLAPLTSRFPLWVLVIPRGISNAHFRDPSHTGANSAHAITLVNSITAITAVGVDSITVNTTLNANTTIYDVFVIPGDTASMANGIYYPSNCTAPPDAWGDPEPGDEPDVAILMDGGIILGGTTPQTLLKDVSGIYTLVPGKHDDTLYDRQTGQASVDVKIPDPTFKTGYIGG